MRDDIKFVENKEHRYDPWDTYPSGYFYVGDVLIGTGYGWCEGGHGKAESVGGDREIQMILDQWLVVMKQKRKEEEQRSRAAAEIEIRNRNEIARTAARAALGLDKHNCNHSSGEIAALGARIDQLKKRWPAAALISNKNT